MLYQKSKRLGRSSDEILISTALFVYHARAHGRCAGNPGELLMRIKMFKERMDGNARNLLLDSLEQNAVFMFHMKRIDTERYTDGRAFLRYVLGEDEFWHNKLVAMERPFEVCLGDLVLPAFKNGDILRVVTPYENGITVFCDIPYWVNELFDDGYVATHFFQPFLQISTEERNRLIELNRKLRMLRPGFEPGSLA